MLVGKPFAFTSRIRIRLLLTLPHSLSSLLLFSRSSPSLSCSRWLSSCIASQNVGLRSLLCCAALSSLRSLLQKKEGRRTLTEEKATSSQGSVLSFSGAVRQPSQPEPDTALKTRLKTGPFADFKPVSHSVLIVFLLTFTRSAAFYVSVCYQ